MSKFKINCPHCQGEISIKGQTVLSETEANELIHWEDKFKIGVPEIDTQHEVFVDIVNEMYVAMRDETPDYNFLKNCISRLHEYVNNHFRQEEELFSPTDYPKTDVHKDKHKRFMSYLEILDVEIESSVFQLRPALKFLVQWFIHHIQNIDRGYVEYVNK